MVARKTRVRARATKTSKSNVILNSIKSKIFSSHGFPIFLGFTLMGILFVLFRMKSIEIDYKISSINKDINKVIVENKEISAIKAKMLSVRNLKSMARKYKLSQPRQKQIIVIR
ncbi:MAG: hypothetical protein HN576_17410 [Bacteriovoracaceae bacterium]|nr:hypothetical protein [Bacteriovoracaceae bacterium]